MTSRKRAAQQDTQKPAEQQGHKEQPRIATGELFLKVIYANPGLKMMAVHGSVGETRFIATVKPEAIQSFGKFQVAAFTAAGVWPRCQFVEGVSPRSAASNWADMISDAMSAGASR